MVSKRIIALRKSNGWTVRELAKMVGVSIETMYTYERGVEPRLKYLRKIAKTFDVTIDFIADGKSYHSKKIETLRDFKSSSSIKSKKERDKIIHYLLQLGVKRK